MSNEHITKLIKQNLRKLPSGARAYLFGSQARGDARPDSDWDVLIVLDKEKLDDTDFDNYSYPLFELGWKHAIQITPIMYTLKEWLANKFTLFYKNVEKDGIQLI